MARDQDAARGWDWIQVLALAVALLTTGCGSRIDLVDLAPYAARDAEGRRVLEQVDGLAPKFRLEPQDVLVFSYPDAKLGLKATKGPDLQSARLDVKIPLWVARSYGAIDVSMEGIGTETLCFGGDPESDPLPDICTVTLTAADDAAEMIRKVEGATNLVLTVDPMATRHLRPGERVEISLEWHMSFSGPELRLQGRFLFSERVAATVGPDGRLTVPRLQLGSTLFDNPECDRFPDSLLVCAGGQPTPLPVDARPFARERAVAAALEALDGQVRVWRPGGPVVPLWRIERCINAVGWTARAEPLPGLEAECRALGIGTAFLPEGKPDYLWPRYNLHLGPQVWTLVDVKGRSHAVPLVAGVSVETAVRAAYERFTGRPIDRAGGVNQVVPYLVVVPANGTAPFFGQTAPGEDAPRLSAVALLGGDRVFVTRLRPKTGAQ